MNSRRVITRFLVGLNLCLALLEAVRGSLAACIGYVALGGVLALVTEPRGRSLLSVRPDLTSPESVRTLLGLVAAVASVVGIAALILAASGREMSARSAVAYSLMATTGPYIAIWSAWAARNRRREARLQKTPAPDGDQSERPSRSDAD